MEQPAIRVLIVEDNPGDFELARRMLESIEVARFTFVHASTLAAALAELDQDVALVLLDLNLPDSQDLDTLHRLRSRALSVPILILTGIEDRQKAVQALAQGAQDYLVKGQVDSHLLARAIARHLDMPDPKTPAS